MKIQTKWLIVGIYTVLRDRCTAALNNDPSLPSVSKGTRIGDFAFEVKIDRLGVAVIPKIAYVEGVNDTQLPAYFAGLMESEKAEVETLYTVRAMSEEPPRDILGAIVSDLSALVTFSKNGWQYEENQAASHGAVLNYNMINKPAMFINSSVNDDVYMVSGPLDVTSEKTGITLSVRQNPRNLHQKYISADIDVTISREVKFDELFAL